MKVIKIIIVALFVLLIILIIQFINEYPQRISEQYRIAGIYEGKLYEKRLDYTRSIENYQKIINTYPLNDEIRYIQKESYHAIARIYKDKLKDLDKALEIYLKMYKMYDNLWFLPSEIIDIGDNYLDEKMYDKAIEVYEKLIKLEPNYANDPKIQLEKEEGSRLYINLGLAYFRKDNYEKAIQCWRKALEFDPTSEIAKNNLKSVKRVEEELHLGKNLIKAAERYRECRSYYNQLEYELRYKTLSTDIPQKAQELKKYLDEKYVPAYIEFGGLVEKYGNKYGAVNLRDFAITNDFFDLISR